MGSNGTILHYDGTAWQPIYGVNTSEDLFAVWGSSPVDVWVSGDAGTLLHFEGTDWIPVDADATVGLQAISGVDATIWIVGYDSTIRRLYHAAPWTCQATEISCAGGLDDDCDGAVDCDDSDCVGNPACP